MTTLPTASSFLRPSAAATWMVCFGYAAMRAAYPNEPEEADNDVREDGTACHWLASEVWDGRTVREGSLSPNTRVIDDAMFDAVDIYHDVLRSWHGVEAVCEKSVPLDAILVGMSGTPDAWSYDPDKKLLRIADLKYGFRFVEVWRNWQLICYAIGLIYMLGLDPLTTTVEFTIVQPRCSHRDGPVRTWTTPARPIIFDWLPKLREGAAKANAPNPACTPNPGCTDCPARHACVALQASAMVAIESSYEGVPHELTPVAAGTELQLITNAIKRLEARKSGLEAQIETQLRKGVTVPGWHLGTTYARERWREGTEAQLITFAREYLASDVAKEQRAISPAQARKVIPHSIVAMYAEKPSTGVRLMKMDPNEITKKMEQSTR